MELDALKEIWQEAAVNRAGRPQHNEIMEMLGKSSHSPVARMMRNVIAEMILIIVLFGAVALFYLIAFERRFISIAWVYIIVAALCSFYYYRKWKLLHSMQCAACQVKSNLQRQVNKLESYIRFYLIAGTALVPVIFIFLGLLFYYKFPEGSLNPIFPPSHAVSVKTWLGWAGSLTLLTVIAWYGNRYYIRKLYGRHILRLKELLGQMEEQ